MLTNKVFLNILLQVPICSSKGKLAVPPSRNPNHPLVAWRLRHGLNQWRTAVIFNVPLIAVARWEQGVAKTPARILTYIRDFPALPWSIGLGAIGDEGAEQFKKAIAHFKRFKVDFPPSAWALPPKPTLIRVAVTPSKRLGRKRRKYFYK